VCEIPHEGPFCDLMWSDPEDIETWAVSPRGAGWLFGRKVTSEFNQINGKCGGLWRLPPVSWGLPAGITGDPALAATAAKAHMPVHAVIQ